MKLSWKWRPVSLRSGLGRRILKWFLVLSLVPLLMSNSVGYLVTRRIIEDQTRLNLTALTTVESHHVSDELDRQLLYLRSLAASAALWRGRLAADDATTTEAGGGLQGYLEGQLAEHGELSALALIDSSGRVVEATRDELWGTDWSDSLLFASARERSFVGVSHEPHRGQIRPRYWFGVPITDGPGSLLGVLAATVDYERVGGLLQLPPHIADHVHAYLVDGEGLPLFISHPHREIDYSERFASPLATAEVTDGLRYTNYEGLDVYGVAVDIAGTRWRYISEIPTFIAFGQLRTLGLIAVALESIFALLLVAAVWIVAGSIVSPLRDLVGAAERIREGELGAVVDAGGRDELGDLGRTFNQMSRELEASARQIKEYHDQEMRRAAQLASVGELASGIAHEIKNPLVGIGSGIDLLEERLADDEAGREILELMARQVDSMDSAVGDLLRYARPKPPRRIRVDPEKILERVHGLIRAQAETADVQIWKLSSPDLPQIFADPDQLTEALVNLALNGIQAMKGGGVLKISAESKDGEVRFAISDTGPGIVKDRLEKIFRPFYTTKHHGSGLGLAISRGIVERHGGRLDIESQPGEGATFTLVLESSIGEPVSS